MSDKVRRSFPLAAAFLLTVLALTSVAQAQSVGQVNLNSASTQELSLLPRIGAKVAERIVTFRKENGPFKRTEDVMGVKGIGEKSFNVLRPYLTLSGKTTLTDKVHLSRKASKSPASNPSTKPAPKPTK